MFYFACSWLKPSCTKLDKNGPVETIAQNHRCRFKRKSQKLEMNTKCTNCKIPSSK